MESAYLCLLVCVLVVFVDFNQCVAVTAGALGSNCTAAGNCASVANATCTTNICQCVPSHKAVQQKCILKVIGKPCNSSTESTVCTLKHSVCTSTACACKIGFKNKEDQCLTVLGTSCVSGSGSSVCKTPNSGCPATGKCSCNAKYVEEDGICLNALGETCKAATDCVSNADCETTAKTCKCKAGFVDTNGLCAEPSSAVTIKIAMSTVGILMLLNVILKAF